MMNNYLMTQRELFGSEIVWISLLLVGRGDESMLKVGFPIFLRANEIIKVLPI